MENFITKIEVIESRNVKNLTIPLSDTERQHLIITGKNGSGKTSLLLELNKFFKVLNSTGNFVFYNRYLSEVRTLKAKLKEPSLSYEQKISIEQNLLNSKQKLDLFGNTVITLSTSKKILRHEYQKGTFVTTFFPAKRTPKFSLPKGISKINLKTKYLLEETVNTNFIQYLVNLKADRSFAKDDKEEDEVKRIDKWFNRFENLLKTIFDNPSLQLTFDRRIYNFTIVTNNDSIPFGFDTLSDGYSAILSIVTELLLRMEAHNAKAYDLEGVVLIDEIETHLHVDLQKKVLPFLVDFFPKIQFIVATHSPFVLSSIQNATVCDLEKRIVTTDLSGYSYDALLESYFDTDKYSTIVKNMIQEYEVLLSIDKFNPSEKERLRHLKDYFAQVPKYLSTELLVKLQELQLKELLAQ